MSVRRSFRRPAAAVAAAVLLIVAPAAPAAAAPEPPAPQIIDLGPLQAPVVHPDTASFKATDPKTTTDCAAVRTKLADYARAGTPTVTCFSTNPAEAAAPAGRSAGKSRAVAAAPVWCATSTQNTWYVTRSSICVVRPKLAWAVIDTRTGAKLGGAAIELASDIELSATSLTGVESYYITMTEGWGTLARMIYSYTPTCTPMCTATNTPATTPVMVLGTIIGGTIRFITSPSTQTSFVPTYTLNAVAPGDPPAGPTPLSGSPNTPIRCDRIIGANPGCVVPFVTPTFFVSTAESGGSAMMLRYAQAFLPDKWGKNVPLHRLASPSLQATNRRVICQDGTFVPDSRVVGGDSCDEFPFAATWESGNMLGLIGPDCAEVRPFISETTGTWVVAKYPGVDDTERCIRGHVAGPDNSDVGSRLGAFAQSQRLLDLDPYWLTVTA